MDLLKRHKEGSSSRAVNSVIRRAADAITNLAHENSSIKTRVRFASLCAAALYSASSFLLLLLFFFDHMEWIYICRMEGGIPPLVELLEFTDTKVQRAAAGALRTLAFKNDENKNQVRPFFH